MSQGSPGTQRWGVCVQGVLGVGLVLGGAVWASTDQEQELLGAGKL